LENILPTQSIAAGFSFCKIMFLKIVPHDFVDKSQAKKKTQL